MMLTLVFGSKKGRKEVSPPALGLLPTLDGTREPWGAGELVPLISPPPLRYLSQAGDEPGKVPPVPKYAAEITFPSPPPHHILLLSKNLEFPACILLLWT